MQLKFPKLNFSHTSFTLLYCAFSYIFCNAINFSKISKWFLFKSELDYLGMTAFIGFGFCVYVAFFLLISTRKSIKFFAILLIILSTIATYFINKYSVAIDRSMLMNVINTDPSEVHSLLSFSMVPYIILAILAIFLILKTKIEFRKNYFLVSLKFIIIFLLIAATLVYSRFDSISRATNLSKKYIIHTLTPLNYVRSLGSVATRQLKPYFSKEDKKVEIVAKISKKEDLIVVLAVGETSRQKSFSLYGYKKNTNPLLSKDKKIHALNGHARIGSTLYALPEILTKNEAALTAVAHQAGVQTFCYANYTLYDNCKIPGEVKVSNCPRGTCYDEDVIPLLAENLKSYQAGQRLIVLHLGGGSHGPSYFERYPPEFQQFKPMCFDADVVNHCSLEELYNAYDNSILYVDFVLNKIIAKLDEAKKPYVFIYLSDHGESLLENDQIFHGMPPGIELPEEQSHIPLLVKSSLPIKIENRQQYEQRDIFDTVLSLLLVESNFSEKNRSFIKK